MVSIIIASTDPEQLGHIKQNIKDTIGLPYEIIAIANKDKPVGLCTVYNDAVAKAKYDLICFMHEDILLHTLNWGCTAVNIMKDPLIGVLGVAGGTYKSLTPGGWACPGLETEGNKVNLIQHYKYQTGKAALEYYNSKKEPLARVASVDGVWIFTRREVVEEFPFDSGLLKGFHGYDIDFSLNVAGKYQIAVTFDILLEHFSEGNYNAAWLDAMLKIHAKHKNILPLNVGKTAGGLCRKAEKRAVKLLLENLTKERFHILDKMRVLWNLDIYRVFGWPQFLSVCFKILIKRY